MGLLSGKRGLIMGVANERSAAWGIAKAASEAGAEIAYSYQGEGLKSRVSAWQSKQAHLYYLNVMPLLKQVSQIVLPS